MNEEINLFSYETERYKITKPIRLIETFTGIGSQFLSLKRIGANVVSWKSIEIDKAAVNSYNAIYNTTYVPCDITQTHWNDLEIIERESYTYILTYSFPCVDLSNAGQKKGMEKGSGTRSGLLWEIERILDECNEHNCLPDLLLMENVPLVHGKKNANAWNQWVSKLSQLGYSNFAQDLNAKDYGIPQNRNRCFMVSILGNYYYQFPKPIELKYRLKDFLEDKVDEKYFLSDAMVEYFEYNTQKQKENGNGFIFDPIDVEEQRERE